MGFFDDKEDVLELKLTQYGKHRLSLGKFNPTYYAFFDDDVLYDGKYAGVVEAQNSIETRIRAVPKTKVQHAQHGVETEVRRINRMVRSGDAELGAESIQPTADRHYSLAAPLGNTSLESNKAPAYHVRFLRGKMSGSVEYSTGSHPTVRIPQLDVEVMYKTSIGRIDDLDENKARDLPEVESQEVDFDRFANSFEDSTFIHVEEDQIILMIDEHNVPFLSENFEIEVFMIEPESDVRLASAEDPKENLVPLSFVRSPERVRNGILLDDVEHEEPELDPSYVEYFIDVNVDDEIDRFELCKALGESGDLSRSRHDQTIDCSELKELGQESIYRGRDDFKDDCTD